MKPHFPLVCALLATPAMAKDDRQLDAHEHGVGEFNIAFDGNTVAMELHAPGADIVGFEYTAKSAEDRAAVDAAVALLARPLELFVLPAEAECTVTQASAKLQSEGAHVDHAKDEDHDHGHKHDHDHGHGHDDHANHGEAHHEGKAGHTEFHAEYTLNCANPDAITRIKFAYFDTFANARKLDIQIVSSSGARALEVEREAPTLDLRGVF